MTLAIASPTDSSRYTEGISKHQVILALCRALATSRKISEGLAVS
jgi:hypothetical protein